MRAPSTATFNQSGPPDQLPAPAYLKYVHVFVGYMRSGVFVAPVVACGVLAGWIWWLNESAHSLLPGTETDSMVIPSAMVSTGNK